MLGDQANTQDTLSHKSHTPKNTLPLMILSQECTPGHEQDQHSA